MQDSRFYRDEAARARRLAGYINHPEAREALLNMAKEYQDIATDLELGAIEITHPGLMPQSKRD